MTEMLRRCGRCRQMLPMSAFARYGGGSQSYCRACQKEYDAAWYSANKAKRQAKVRADREAHVAWMDSLKEGKPCADCGRSYTRRAAHSKKRILAELEKCELVCANCHRERTFGRRARGAA